MIKNIFAIVLIAIVCFPTVGQTFDGPLFVHPENGRYFTDNSGKAIYLTGSHTWANFQEIGLPGDAPFDWKGYLDLLEDNHHNFIRLWIWEQSQKASWTQDDILFSPLPYQMVKKNGKESYDLTKWNEAFFDRLHQRVTDAGKRGIYVSVMLFQGWSLNKTDTPNGDPWPYNPFNPKNNINGVGKQVVNNDIDDAEKGTLHSMNNGDVLSHQEAFVKKVLETLNGSDNVLYEILNEGGTKAWQYHIIDYIKKTEANMANQHPVGMSHAVTVEPKMVNQDLWDSEADWVSPAPEPLAWMYKGSKFLENYQYNPPVNTGEKVVILDTDHLWGIGGTYAWAWKSFVRGHNPIFMDSWVELAGDLDKDKMAGMFLAGGILKAAKDYPDWGPLRKNMGYIRQLADRMDLIKMVPHNGLSSTTYCLANPGDAYVVYFPNGEPGTLDLKNATGDYEMEWFIPILNQTIKGNTTIKGGSFETFSPPFSGDAVLYLKKL